jgi:hypothetical protein
MRKDEPTGVWIDELVDVPGRLDLPSASPMHAAVRACFQARGLSRDEIREEVIVGNASRALEAADRRLFELLSKRIGK